MSAPAPEMRRDRLTQRWVAYAPERSDRPQRTDAAEGRPDQPEDLPVEGCPFCPGHEDQLPEVHWQLDGGNGPWQTRAVPNKYPALTSNAPAPSPARSTLYESRCSTGRQEVIIDTPFHHRQLVCFSAEEMDALFRTYLERYRTLRRTEAGLYPLIFRNHGAAAGASIDHPHSQIIATAEAPSRIRREETAARTWYEETGRCPYCAMLEAELRAEDRLVTATDAFVAFTPYAARVPYEMWILPRRHNPEFGAVRGPERKGLAVLVRDLLARLNRSLNDPTYNYFVRTALDHNTDAPFLHWSLRIYPRTSLDAGFEVGGGFLVNPSLPERDAAVLREAG